MAEQFMGGIQYLCTIIANISRENNENRLNSLNKALASFKTKGVHASLEYVLHTNLSYFDVVLDVYVDVAGQNRKFMPPLVTRDTAQAYYDLIQILKNCGYDDPKVFRDSARTGITEPNEIPLFEITDTTSH